MPRVELYMPGIDYGCEGPPIVDLCKDCLDKYGVNSQTVVFEREIGRTDIEHVLYEEGSHGFYCFICEKKLMKEDD